MSTASDPVPDDLLVAADALRPLTEVPDGPRWQATAAPTGWTAERALDHVVDALLFYVGQVARRAGDWLPVLRDGGATVPAAQRLDTVRTAATVLRVQLRDLGTGRAWHPSGLADAGGWVGMAVTELLVHGRDVAGALGVPLPLPEAVCLRTVRRVFPWVPDTGDPAATLLAVTGRGSMLGVPVDPSWWWQSAPLSEWDGRPQRRTNQPLWR